MKLKIKTNLLLENLNHVSKAISNKNIIPILSGIKFDLTKKGLYLMCSDDDITIQTFIDKKAISQFGEEGTVIIPGRYIIEILKKLNTEILDIETDGLKIIISTPTSVYNLNGMDPLEYPNKNLEYSKNPITINKKIIKNIINQTSFSISTQESRPILTGINFKIKDNTLVATATDSYRLAQKTVILEEKIEEQIDIVVPGKNLIELLKTFDEEEEKIEIHIFSNKILFKFSNIIFQSRLLNGTYPNVSNLIPTDFNIDLMIDSHEIYSAIDRASLFSEKEKNVVHLEVNKEEMIIKSTSAELGKVEERIILKDKQDSELKIAFNARYMMEALRSLQSKEVKILLQNEMKPIIVKDPKNEYLIQLILPVKTY